ncbi:MAG TPA: OmpA family protein [Polyangiaceae bacterium]|nr:OmpA family protein [Polyangiaceae bacterium]
MTLSKALGPCVAVAVASLALAACGGSKPPVATPTAANAPAPSNAPSSSTAAQSPTASSVSISDEIRTKCGIPDADAYFTFDSSHVTTKDRSPLDLVARCFTSGPLAGHSVKLVGRADPRGESDYNITLGQSRADAVGSYLDGRGLAKGKTLTTSRGSMDANGTDESGWQHDRRVDVMLGD